MEIELKYIVEDRIQAEAIFSFLEQKGYIESSEREVKRMQATYYDTDKMDLMTNKIALRIRKEGAMTFATLKWSGIEKEGLHKRQEINEILDDSQVKNLNWRHVFKKHDVSKQLEDIIKEKDLRPIFETDILREIAVIKFETSKIEIVYDKGNVMSKGIKDAVEEIELELLEGNEEDLIKLGKRLSEEFQISPSSVTKFERGLRLIQ